jgi:hypothetical protein
MNIDHNPNSKPPGAPESEGAALSPEPSGGQGVNSEVPSAEEQMARFEEELKESDWGHQPC